MSKTYSKTRTLVECALMIALGTVLANIKIFEMPNGGSITLEMLPIILFSSLITDALYEKGVKVGADRQVSKPDLPGLNKIIREVISEKLNK